MSEFIGDGTTRVFWTTAGNAPVEIPVEGVKIQMQYVDPDEIHRLSVLRASGFFTPVTVRGTVKLSPFGYRALFRRTHPRIRRMHLAYGRKRGRGRW